ncbi:MAG: replicative DNA helicase [Acetatifactor sp.]|nr:replicative DNA helicase [Acetatifactor sp.]
MEENVLKRILPHSMEAEQSVIGSMIMDREAIVIASELITGEDFYNRQYGILFETMVELNDEGNPVDLVTLQNRLREKDVPPEVSSLEFVRDLITAVPTSANIKYYANIVAEKATLRRLIRLNEEIANTCYAGKESLEYILDDTEKKVFQLVQKRTTDDFVPIRQVVMNALDRIETAAKNKGSVTGVPTGFIDLDYRTAGMQPSDLILIAARPSMGKTALALNIAQYVAFKKNMSIAIFSLEMSKEQLVNRMFSLESSVDAQKLRTGQLNDQEWERLIESAGTIGKSNLIIDDTPGISVAELRSKCRKYKLEQNLSMIMIDYLQLMTGSGRSDSRQQEISDISRSLKAIARELNVPVIALSQLSRAVEQRPDHRPMLSDLRESGAIEQDADVVMFIYRDDYYNHDTDKKGISEIIIAKQRNGPIGTVELAWLPEYTKFANLEHRREKADF